MNEQDLDNDLIERAGEALAATNDMIPVIRAFAAIVEALAKLDPDERRRVLRAATILVGELP